MCPSESTLPYVQVEYERLRKHGLSHDAALEAVDAGDPYRCWCGRPDPCVGGAQRLIGCPIQLGNGSNHSRHRSDLV